MKTKDKIVQKLLEDKHITAEEAIILLREKSLAVSGFINSGCKSIITDGKTPYFEVCGCNVCNCNIGNKKV